jgi:hypothetical protein
MMTLEGAGLALAGAGRLVVLAEALVLGLQVAEVPLKGLGRHRRRVACLHDREDGSRSCADPGRKAGKHSCP